MANQPEDAGTFPGGVYQIETTDPVLGGVGGVSNLPLLQLASRTAWLKAQLDAIRAGAPVNLDTFAEVATAIALLAPLASPALTGTPTAPTASVNTNNTQIATTAFVQAVVNALIDAAPGALDTLNELAAALGDDPNFAATMTAALAGKANKSGDQFSGAVQFASGDGGGNNPNNCGIVFVGDGDTGFFNPSDGRMSGFVNGERVLDLFPTLINFIRGGQIRASINADGGSMTLHRNDNAGEGGQLNLTKALDDTIAWNIDVFGSGASTNLRFNDVFAGVSRLEILSNGRVYLAIGLQFADGTTQNTAAKNGNYSGVTTLTGNTTLTDADAGGLFSLQPTGAGVTIQLPTPVGKNGASYTFFNQSNFNAYVQTAAGQNISFDSGTVLSGTVEIAQQRGLVEFVSDGANWRVNVIKNKSVHLANAYYILPNGIVIQWGTTTASSSSAGVSRSFSISFPNACFGVYVTPSASSNGFMTSIEAITTSNFTLSIYSNNTTRAAGVTAYYIAIGY